MVSPCLFWASCHRSYERRHKLPYQRQNMSIYVPYARNFTLFSAVLYRIPCSRHHISLKITGAMKGDINCPIRGKICQFIYLMSVISPFSAVWYRIPCSWHHISLGSQELRKETQTALSEAKYVNLCTLCP